MSDTLTLSFEIAKLRSQIPGIEQEIKSHNDVYNEVNGEIEELRRIFEESLKKMQERREQIYSDLYAEKNRLAGLQNEILVKSREYNKLLELENQIEALSRLEKELEEICKDFEAWSSAHPYQVQDILFTINAFREGRNGILNANDLGLGKTFETIVALFILQILFEKETGRAPRILWLTKKTLIRSSQREVQRWWPESNMLPLEGSRAKTEREFIVEVAVRQNAPLITNYEAVRTTQALQDITWDIIVIDEVHKLKGGANSKPTAIWKAIKDLCHKARFSLMLSGTPMVNRAEEMWSYLHIFSPEKFPSIRQFQNHFCEYRKVAGEYKLEVSPDKILNNALKGQMIRRRRDEVGLQLPELTREYRFLEMEGEQLAVYEQMRNYFYLWLDENQDRALTATAIIAQLTRLRQINVWPAGIHIEHEGKEITLNIEESCKIDECMDIIDEAQDQVIVFSTFNAPLFEVQRRANEAGLSCAIISGETSGSIAEIERKFQNGEIDVLCINSAMGEGLNLQKNPGSWSGGSSIAIFLDLWWSPARNEQCEGRIHRQGANQPVTIYVLQNESSVDGFIKSKLDEKAAIFESIMESDEIRPASDWREYLKGKI